MQLHDQMVALALHHHATDGALHAAHDRLRGEHAPRSMTHRARLGHVLQVALSHALTGHLHEAEIAHRERLGARAVAAEVSAQLLQDLVAVRPRLHVDEIRDDDAAHVTQA